MIEYQIKKLDILVKQNDRITIENQRKTIESFNKLFKTQIKNKSRYNSIFSFLPFSFTNRNNFFGR